MKVYAVGDKTMIIPLQLAGIKESREVSNSNEALNYIREIDQSEENFLVFVDSKFYLKLREEIKEIQERNVSAIIYEFEGDGLSWYRNL